MRFGDANKAENSKGTRISNNTHFYSQGIRKAFAWKIIYYTAMSHRTLTVGSVSRHSILHELNERYSKLKVQQTSRGSFVYNLRGILSLGRL